MFAIRLSKARWRQTCFAQDIGLRAPWSGRASPGSVQSSTQSWSEASSEPDAPLDRRRHHVEPEDAVELVGRDLGLVRFPVAALQSRGQELERGAAGRCRPARRRRASAWSPRSGCPRSSGSPRSSGTPRTRRGVPSQTLDPLSLCRLAARRRIGGGAGGACGATAGACARARRGREDASDATNAARNRQLRLMGFVLLGEFRPAVYTGGGLCFNAGAFR